MAQEGEGGFFSIKNFERYQHYKQRTPPWIKLYNSMLDDPEFVRLGMADRFLYCGLLLVASRLNNRIPHNEMYIQNALQTRETINLSVLFNSGFLLAWCRKTRLAQSKRSALSQSRERDRVETEGERETEKSIVLGPASPPKANRGCILPDNFEPDERHTAIATGFGLNVHKEVAHFKDHHVAKGTIFKDWPAAFRNWLRKAAEYKKR